MTTPLVVGVDPHRATNTSAFLDAQGHDLAPRLTFSNNRPGTEAFLQHLVHIAETAGCDTLRIATEATGWYWWHFFQTIDRHPLLHSWPLELYAFNPRLTTQFSKSYADHDHTDRSDAGVIAERLRWGRELPAPFHLDERFLALRLLTRYRTHLMHLLAREKAYCISILYLKASEYTRLKPFADVFGAASRALLQEFSSLEEIAALPLEELAEWLDVQGKRKFVDPMVTARRVQQVARDSYEVPSALQEPINLIVQLSLQQISSVEREVKRLERAIEAQMAGFPNTLTTIPGLGPVYAAGLLSEIGDISRFGFEEAKVAKYAGLKWRKHQSGQFEAEETMLTRRGNAYLRYYLCEAANSVRMHAAEYGAYYERKVKEVRQHQHKRAVVLTARKLVRLVVRLLTTAEAYRGGREARA